MHSLRTLLMLFLTTLSTPVLAVANPEDGGVGSGSAEAAILCERGFVYSAERRGCVRPVNGVIGDEELYQRGRALALEGHYPGALDALLAIEHQGNADAFNMIGYCYRMLGRFDEAIAAYEKALAIDPEHLWALEYLGEAYAEIGQLDLAREQLARMEAIGALFSDQYFELAEAIFRAQNSQ